MIGNSRFRHDRRRACRRLFAVVVATAGASGSPAQSTRDLPRVGMLVPTAPTADGSLARISAALSARGRVDGRSITVLARHAGGVLDRLPALARELVDARVDVMVAVSASAARATMQASATMPIVFFGNFDPVALGIVPSLARPGGRATGVLIASDGTLAAKRLELLREAVPGARRIAVLAPDDANAARQLDEIRKAAATIGVSIVVVEVRGGDYERAFAGMVAERPAALFVAAHTFFMRDRATIIALANRHRLPAVYEWPEQADDGGLIAYGADLAASYASVAEAVDRILSGARPGDLPVLQPTTFELVVNLRTAQAIGLALPASLLKRADRVVR